MIGDDGLKHISRQEEGKLLNLNLCGGPESELLKVKFIKWTVILLRSSSSDSSDGIYIGFRDDHKSQGRGFERIYVTTWEVETSQALETTDEWKESETNVGENSWVPVCGQV